MYTGEIDEIGSACGYGTAVRWKDDFERGDQSIEYSGTWFNGVPHGIRKSKING